MITNPTDGSSWLGTITCSELMFLSLIEKEHGRMART